MKSLLIILLSLGLAGCRYSSEQRARKACDDWRMKQAEVKIISFKDEQPVTPVDRAKQLQLALSEIDNEDLSAYRDAEKFRSETRAFQIDFYAGLVDEDRKGRQMIEHQVTARWCRADSNIKQILGYENNKVINNTWQNIQGGKGNGELVRRFRY